MNETQRDWSQPIKGSDFTPELARDFLAEMCKRGCGYQMKNDFGRLRWEEFPETPHFSTLNLYRLPPMPRTEPFTQATVPKGALWRQPRSPDTDWLTVSTYRLGGLCLSDCEPSSVYNWNVLKDVFEYSDDGGHTWHKAERSVE